MSLWAGLRSTPFEDTLRQYATTAELLATWAKVDTAAIATLTLGTGSLASIHPAKFAALTINNTSGATQIVGMERQVFLLDGAANFWIATHYAIDASLAGVGLSISQGYAAGDASPSASTATFTPTCDGTWYEIGDAGSAVHVTSGEFGGIRYGTHVKLAVTGVPAAATGVVRFQWARMIRQTPYAAVADSSTAPVLPFLADVDAADLSQTMDFRTDVLTGANTREQRTALRELARGTLHQTFTFLTPREAGLFDAILFNTQGAYYSVPVWSDALRTTAGVGSGSTTMSVADVDYTTRQFVPGAQMMFWADPFTYDVCTVGPSGGPSSLTLSTSTTRAWPAGSVVVPLAIVRLANPVPVARPTARTGRVALVLDLVRG